MDLDLSELLRLEAPDLEELLAFERAADAFQVSFGSLEAGGLEPDKT